MSGLLRGELPFVYRSVQSDLSSHRSIQNFSYFLLGAVVTPRFCLFRLQIHFFKKSVSKKSVSKKPASKKHVSKTSFPISFRRAAL